MHRSAAARRTLRGIRPLLAPIDRRILALAIPAFGALAAEPLYRLVDTAIVGRLGKEELGGVAIAVSVLSLVIAGSNFLAYGTTERVARRLGAADHTAAANVGVQAVWLASLIGVVSVPVLIVAARPFAIALGADGDVLAFAVTYLRISALGVPFVLVGLAAQGVQRGASDYRTPLIVLVCANIVNLVVEVVLVLVLDVGVAGAAWSTVLAQILAGLALVALGRRHLGAASQRRPDWAQMVPLLTAGRHLLLRVGSMLVVFTGATALAARVDDATLAAHQIAVSVFFFAALSLDALAVPAQTLVAESFGRSDDTLAGSADSERTNEDSRTVAANVASQTGPVEPDPRTIASRSARLSLAIGAVLGALLIATAPLLARVFTAESDVIDRATPALVFLGAILVPGAIAFAYDGSLIGAGDYRFLGRAAFVYLLAIVPAAVVVIMYPGVGIAGIWGALLGWMILRAVVNHLRVRRLFGTVSSAPEPLGVV